MSFSLTSRLDEFSEIFWNSPNGVKATRSLVFNLATTGKLVPQVNHEKHPKDLLDSVGNEDFAHESLSGWLNLKLNFCAEIFNGNSTSSSEKVVMERNQDGLNYIATKDVGYGLEPIQYNTSLRIGSTANNFKIAPKNAILICLEGGSAGKKMGLVEREIAFGNKLFAVVCKSGIDSNYLLIYFLSSKFQKDFHANLSGIIGGISKAKFSNLQIPIPPIEEQRRIVNKVKNLINLVDCLETKLAHRDSLGMSARKSAVDTISTAQTQEEFATAWKRIEENWKVMAGTPESLESLRVLILTLAVSGKLSRQLRTTNESNSLLPIDWGLKEFSEVANFSIGKTPPTKETKYWGGEDSIMWVSIGDMQNGGKVLETNRRISPSAQSEIFRRSPWPPGTLLMSFKLTIGKVSRLVSPAFFNEAIFAFDSGNEVTNEYLFRVLPFISQRADSKGAIKGNTLNSQSIRKMLIPIPPIDEQSRLVNIIDQLNQFCDDLESQLSTQVSLAEKFARSIVSQAG
jgi:type I restriction enzyme S subunit